MQIIYSPLVLQHEPGEHHPENSRRFSYFKDLPPVEIPDGEAYLGLVHLPGYIERIKDVSQSGGLLDLDTTCSKGSFTAAKAAVGATILAAQNNGFALVRPPGHHAFIARASGFCIFNNIAIACKHLVNQGKRVFILDFDGHYGDGTASFFYDSNQVLYLSLHQSPGFPWEGNFDEIGNRDGKGYTINVPLPPGTGDDLYLKALERLLPVAMEFNPDVVAISAGFDGHWSDRLLHLRLSLNLYYRIGVIIGSHFPAVFASLEGGYQPEILYKGVLNFIAGIKKEAIPFPEMPTTSNEKTRDFFEDNFGQLRRLLKTTWESV